MPEAEGGICYHCTKLEQKVSSRMGNDENYIRCSKGYLFLQKKYACVGYDPITPEG